MRLIDADELLDVFEDLDERAGRTPWMLKDIVDVVDEQPTIEAAPVVHGRWLKATHPMQEQCDQCKAFAVNFALPRHHLPFCPYCNAKMGWKEEGK